jgi:tyrosine-protein kinase Etk/Wzc
MSTNTTTPSIEPRDIAANAQEFDFLAMLDALVLHRRMIAWIFGTVTVLGIAAVFLANPEYEASILTQVDESRAAAISSSPLGQDLLSMFDVKSSVNTETEVLQSRLVLGAAVDDLRLFIEAEPLRVPLIGDAIARSSKGLSQPGLFGMGGFTWGDESIAVSRFDVPDALEGERFRLTLTGAGQYTLTGPDLQDGATGIIGRSETFSSTHGSVTLKVDAIHAVVGASFSLTRQSRLETINALQRHLSIRELGKESNVVQVRLRGTDPERITATLIQVARHYVDHNDSLKSDQAARSLAFLQSQIPEFRQKVDAADGRYAAVRSRLGSVDVEGEARTLLQQSAENETQIAGLMQRRADALTRFEQGHPSVVALDDQIAVLRAQASALNARIDHLPETERDIVKAQRDVKVSNDMYVGLLNNIEELQMLRAGKIGNVRVLDTADRPDQPMRLWRPALSGIVVLIAAFGALAAAFIRDRLFSGVTVSRDVEHGTGLVVYASVPNARRRSRWLPRSRTNPASGRPLALADPADPSIEGARCLRAALKDSLNKGDGNVVLFTGASQSVGKSFISSNFATLLANSGQRVLLIDADLRQSSLSRNHVVESALGLSDIIADNIALDDAIRRVSGTNLDFLPCGTIPLNAADHFSKASLSDFFRLVAERYDLVVVDTSALLVVPDAAILAPHVNGAVVLVARAGTTKASELQECARRLRQVGVTVKGVVLNGVDPVAGYFRYGARYGAYRYARGHRQGAGLAVDGEAR